MYITRPFLHAGADIRYKTMCRAAAKAPKEENDMFGYFWSEPNFPTFSKFMAASKKDEVQAMRTLAKDCFLDGDKELIDNESLFLFGLMGQLSEVISTRQSTIVNF